MGHKIKVKINSYGGIGIDKLENILTKYRKGKSQSFMDSIKDIIKESTKGKKRQKKTMKKKKKKKYFKYMRGGGKKSKYNVKMARKFRRTRRKRGSGGSGETQEEYEIRRKSECAEYKVAAKQKDLSINKQQELKAEVEACTSFMHNHGYPNYGGRRKRSRRKRRRRTKKRKSRRRKKRTRRRRRKKR